MSDLEPLLWSSEASECGGGGNLGGTVWDLGDVLSFHSKGRQQSVHSCFSDLL